MYASRNLWKRTVAAALVIGALTTANSVAQVNSATTQSQTGNATAGGVTAGTTTTTSAGNPAGGIPTGVGAASLPTAAAPNIVGQTLGLTFAVTPGSSLTVSAVAETSPLSGIGLQAGDQILSVNGHPAGSPMSLLNELTRLASGNQAASMTVLSTNGTRQILNVPTAALQQIVQMRQTIGTGGTGPGTGAGIGAGARTGVGPTAGGARAANQNLVTQALGVTIAPTATGLSVTNIANDSPLHGLGLQVGDQIVDVNGQSLMSPQDVLNRLVAAAQNQGSAGATLDVMRNGMPLALTIPMANLQAISQLQAQLMPVHGPVSAQTTRSPGPTTATNTATAANTAAAAAVPTETTTNGTGGVPINPFVQQALDAQAAANESGGLGAVARTAQPGVTTAQQAGVTGAAATTGSTPTVQQALETQASANQTDTSGIRMLSRGAASPGTTQATTDQQAAVNALSGFGTAASGSTAQGATAPAGAVPATPATPATPAVPGVSSTIPATPATPPSTTGEQQPLPTTVITPNGPRIVVPGAAQGPGRGGAGGGPGVPPANAKGAPAGGKAEGKAGGARPSGGGAAAGAAKAGAS